MDLGLTFSGFLVGAIIGFTGIGGGSLMTPLLVILFGISPAIAVGTDLLYAAITKSSGIWIHHKRQTVHWRIVGLLALGSVPSALVMLSVLQYLRENNINYDHLITTSLGFALILTALVILFRGRLLALARHDNLAPIRAAHRLLRTPITVVAGVVIGVLVTLSSVGAGAIGTAVLFFLYPNLRAISIVGTDLAHAVPLTAIAGLGHAHIGTVDYQLLGYLIVGSIPGIYMGSHLGAHLPDTVVRSVLASMLLMIGLRFAF